jgi:NADH-quinone oxidoreductase subunit M
VAFLEQWLVGGSLALPILLAAAVRAWPSLATKRSLLLAVPGLTLAAFASLVFLGDEVPLDPAHTGLALDAVARPLLVASSGVVLAVLASLPKRELTRTQVSAILVVYAGGCWVLLSHGVVSLMLGYVVTTIPVLSFKEFRARRLARFSQGASVVLVGAGLGWLAKAAGTTALSALPDVVGVHPWAFGLVVVGLAIRLGVFPFQTWLVGLFESAPLGPLIMSVAPMPMLIVVERVITPSVAATLGEVPGASASLLVVSSALSAAMVLVQTRLRRALGWFVVSLHSTIFLGVLDPNPVGHLGGLAMWAASTLALTGFAIVVWALFTRRGDIDLTQHSGFHDDAPTLAAAFLLFGLACVGLPGTIDFISEDLTLHGSIAHHPLLLVGFLTGVSILGFAVLFLAFRIFLGSRPVELASVRLPDVVRREKAVLVALALLLLGGGLAPQTIARPLTDMDGPGDSAPAASHAPAR